MLTVVGHNAHFPAKNMKGADECDTDQCNKLQESVIEFCRARIECGDNILGKHKAVWRCVSDDDEEKRKYATH